jgi:hypothetical protein
MTPCHAFILVYISFRVMSRMENSQENGVDGKQVAAEGQFECRLLIPSKMAGSIIGR